MNEDLARMMPTPPEGCYWKLDWRDVFYPGVPYEIRLMRPKRGWFRTKEETVFRCSLRSLHPAQFKKAENRYISWVEEKERFKKYTS